MYLCFEFCPFKIVYQNNVHKVNLMRSYMADWYRWRYSSATDWHMDILNSYATSAECKLAFCAVTRVMSSEISGGKFPDISGNLL